VPAEQVEPVRLSLLLAGTSVALTLAMGTNDATLWAHERFDLINAIEMAAALVQASCSIYFVSRGHALVALTVSLLTAAVVREAAKAGACHRLAREARLPASRPTWPAAKRLFDYALWNSLLGIGQRLTAQGVPMVVGSRLSLASVTPFTVAANLTTYARGFVVSGTGVVTPFATALHATQNRAQQQRLFMEGSRYSWALSLMLVSGLVLLGRSFVILWMGPTLAEASRLLVILALGELLPMSQGIACGLIMGMNRHRVLGATSLIEATAVITLGVVLARAAGLTGICVAVAACAVVCRGIVPMVFICRVLHLSVREYAIHALGPPLAIAAAPVLGLALLVHHRTPASWLEFLLYGAGFCAAFLCLCGRRLRREWRPIQVLSPGGNSGLAASGIID
jgi:O-antigen/teichoic acid export membrane protein